MERLAIIGSGDLGQQIAHHALNDGHYEPVGFFDDWEPIGKMRHNLPVLGNTDDIISQFEKHTFDKLIIGIGYKHINKRKALFELFYPKIPFGTIIHSSSYVDKSTVIGDGSIIYPGCILDMNSKIGNNVVLNVSCSIAHDSKIANHCFLSPSVTVAGFVEIDECVNLGIGTIVIDNLRVSSNIKTGGGCVIIKNLIVPGLYIGIPAKLISIDN